MRGYVESVKYVCMYVCIYVCITLGRIGQIS